jgi:hypothetical protein
MWDSETQRLGKKECTPFGYILHGIADLLGLLGLILLLGTIAYLIYRRFSGTFHPSLLWFLTVPFGLGILGWVIFNYSWFLADKKGFQIDSETGEAIWTEDGQHKTYKWNPSNSDSAE